MKGFVPRATKLLPNCHMLSQEQLNEGGSREFLLQKVTLHCIINKTANIFITLYRDWSDNMPCSE